MYELLAFRKDGCDLLFLHIPETDRAVRIPRGQDLAGG